VARGRAPFLFRAPGAGDFIVSLKTPNGHPWETHVGARARMRAVLRASPGSPRTRITLVAPTDAAGMVDADFTALKDTLVATAPASRLRTLTESARAARLTAVQAGELLDVLSSRERMRALGWFRERLADPDNAPALYNHFPSLADRRRARDVLER
jgi:hypothetical protein